MFKTFEILAHVTFHAYETFGISVKYGFSEATACTLILDRLSILLEFAILVAPLACIVVAAL